jgi:hypothetical protein
MKRLLFGKKNQMRDHCRLLGIICNQQAYKGAGIQRDHFAPLCSRRFAAAAAISSIETDSGRLNNNYIFVTYAPLKQH